VMLVRPVATVMSTVSSAAVAAAAIATAALIAAAPKLTAAAGADRERRDEREGQYFLHDRLRFADPL
jgi:hypothetical protein